MKRHATRATCGMMIAMVALTGACHGEPAVRLGEKVPPLPTAETIGADGTLAPTAITGDMIARGDSIFHGRLAGGTCETCHGPGGQGTDQGPDLRDDLWLNGDGSYDWIARVVRTGIAPPKVYRIAMPPDGGGSLTLAEERSVAAYVYSLRGLDQ